MMLTQSVLGMVLWGHAATACAVPYLALIAPFWQARRLSLRHD